MTSEKVAASDHLIPSDSGGWGWWTHVAVRGAGFPAEGVLNLAAEAVAADADAFVDRGDPPTTTESEVFRRSYDAAVKELDHRLQEIASTPRFREAITWQNHRVLDTGIAPLLRWQPEKGRDRKHRAHEELVASYLQRYCVKNDSIGFFGPVGWGRLDPGRQDIALRLGRKLTVDSGVYFESWAIDSFAESITRDGALRPWLPVRRQPFASIKNDQVLLPGQEPINLTPSELAVLRMCDGRALACDIADTLCGSCDFAAGSEVYAVLDDLARRRLVVWKLELPVTLWPEVALRGALNKIADQSLLEPALAALDRIETARDEVAAAAGNSYKLRAALGDLDSVFRNETGTEPSRHAGRTYAGRTIVYHDCRRDLQLDLGRVIIDALAPLDLLLMSARWLTHEIGRVMRAALFDAYTRIRKEDSGTVDLSTFWFEAMPVVHGGVDGALRQIDEEYRSRWSEILQCSADASTLSYHVASLKPHVRAAFAAPDAGWSGARYCSPDVMIAATGSDAISAGDFELVLGELHVSVNALRHSCFLSQHPHPELLLEAADRDFDQPRLVAVLPKDSPPKLTTRLHSALVRARDFHVAHLHWTADPHVTKVLMSGDLRVEEISGALAIRLQTGERFDVLEIFDEELSAFALDRLRLFADEEPHVPRVNFGRMVVVRESWRWDAAELEALGMSDETARFLAVREWFKRAGLPRHVFVKTPLEQKPFYVDFASPIYLNVLARAVRRLLGASDVSERRIAFTEMLPTFEHAWLVDRKGTRYTSELRFTAIDLSAVGDPNVALA